MAKDILIRNVPDTIHNWIEDERYQKRMSKQDFIFQVLEKASNYGQQSLFDNVQNIAKTVPSAIPFTFIDLFSGIGGFRLGLQRVGGRCLFSCELDANAQKTDHFWFGEIPYSDIRGLNPSDMPDHDILAAVFHGNLLSAGAIREGHARIKITQV